MLFLAIALSYALLAAACYTLWVRSAVRLEEERVGANPSLRLRLVEGAAVQRDLPKAA